MIQHLHIMQEKVMGKNPGLMVYVRVTFWRPTHIYILAAIQNLQEIYYQLWKRHQNISW